MQRRKFNREFKIEAVKLVWERGVALALILATASALPACLPRSARAPLRLPSLTPRALAAASAVRVLSASRSSTLETAS